MAAVVFSITANGTTASQAVGATRVAAVSGLRAGEWVQIEASDLSGASFANATSYLGNVDGRITANTVVSLPLPSGWNVRVTAGNIVGTGTIRVAIE